ncbi:MAG: YiaA/YiaB family inner membrane protein [Deltaproteobacteria bacterium]|nr:YiaA/YiaB family inner membrane protein [Deltaproteobacteria bacterium]
MLKASRSLTADSPAWTFQTWAAFILSLGSTSLGIWFLPVDIWTRSFLGLGLWFTVSSCMTLAKSQRDNHESQKLSAVVEEANTERILRDHSRV